MPAGHYYVGRGPLEPSDLVYSWTTNEWLRHDDPSWLQTVERAEDAVYVARPARNPFETPTSRRYVLPPSRPPGADGPE